MRRRGCPHVSMPRADDGAAVERRRRTWRCATSARRSPSRSTTWATSRARRRSGRAPIRAGCTRRSPRTRYASTTCARSSRRSPTLRHHLLLARRPCRAGRSRCQARHRRCDAPRKPGNSGIGRIARPIRGDSVDLAGLSRLRTDYVPSSFPRNPGSSSPAHRPPARDAGARSALSPRHYCEQGDDDAWGQGSP